MHSGWRASSHPPPCTLQDIRLLQLALKQVLGRDVAAADGVYGPRTKAAVVKFRRRFGLPDEPQSTPRQLASVLAVLRSEARKPSVTQEGPQLGGRAAEGDVATKSKS